MFLIHSTDDGHLPPIETLAAGAITPKVGLALTQNNGLLLIAGGAVRPSYICMTQKSSAVTSGTRIPVMRITPDIVFETVFSASNSAIKPGDKVTIASDGLRVTATTASGVAEVISKDGSAAGDKVRVRFA